MAQSLPSLAALSGTISYRLPGMGQLELTAVLKIEVAAACEHGNSHFPANFIQSVFQAEASSVLWGPSPLELFLFSTEGPLVVRSNMYLPETNGGSWIILVLSIRRPEIHGGIDVGAHYNEALRLIPILSLVNWSCAFEILLQGTREAQLATIYIAFPIPGIAIFETHPGIRPFSARNILAERGSNEARSRNFVLYANDPVRNGCFFFESSTTIQSSNTGFCYRRYPEYYSAIVTREGPLIRFLQESRSLYSYRDGNISELLRSRTEPIAPVVAESGWPSLARFASGIVFIPRAA